MKRKSQFSDVAPVKRPATYTAPQNAGETQNTAIKFLSFLDQSVVFLANVDQQLVQRWVNKVSIHYSQADKKRLCEEMQKPSVSAFAKQNFFATILALPDTHNFWKNLQEERAQLFARMEKEARPITLTAHTSFAEAITPPFHLLENASSAEIAAWLEIVSTDVSAEQVSRFARILSSSALSAIARHRTYTALTSLIAQPDHLFWVGAEAEHDTLALLTKSITQPNNALCTEIVTQYTASAVFFFRLLTPKEIQRWLVDTARYADANARDALLKQIKNPGFSSVARSNVEKALRLLPHNHSFWRGMAERSEEPRLTQTALGSADKKIQALLEQVSFFRLLRDYDVSHLRRYLEKDLASASPHAKLQFLKAIDSNVNDIGLLTRFVYAISHSSYFTANFNEACHAACKELVEKGKAKKLSHLKDVLNNTSKAPSNMFRFVWDSTQEERNTWFSAFAATASASEKMVLLTKIFCKSLGENWKETFITHLKKELPAFSKNLSETQIEELHHFLSPTKNNHLFNNFSLDQIIKEPNKFFNNTKPYIFTIGRLEDMLRIVQEHNITLSDKKKLTEAALNANHPRKTYSYFKALSEFSQQHPFWENDIAFFKKVQSEFKNSYKNSHLTEDTPLDTVSRFLPFYLNCTETALIAWMNKQLLPPQDAPKEQRRYASFIKALETSGMNSLHVKKFGKAFVYWNHKNTFYQQLNKEDTTYFQLLERNTRSIEFSSFQKAKPVRKKPASQPQKNQEWKEELKLKPKEELHIDTPLASVLRGGIAMFRQKTYTFVSQWLKTASAGNLIERESFISLITTSKSKYTAILLSTAIFNETNHPILNGVAKPLRDELQKTADAYHKANTLTPTTPVESVVKSTKNFLVGRAPLIKGPEKGVIQQWIKDTVLPSDRETRHRLCNTLAPLNKPRTAFCKNWLQLPNPSKLFDGFTEDERTHFKKALNTEPSTTKRKATTRYQQESVKESKKEQDVSNSDLSDTGSKGSTSEKETEQALATRPGFVARIQPRSVEQTTRSNVTVFTSRKRPAEENWQQRTLPSQLGKFSDAASGKSTSLSKG